MEGLNLFARSVWDMGKFQRVTRGLRRLFHVSLCFAAIDRAYGSESQDLFENHSHLGQIGRWNRRYSWSLHGLFLVFFMVWSGSYPTDVIASV